MNLKFTEVDHVIAFTSENRRGVFSIHFPAFPRLKRWRGIIATRPVKNAASFPVAAQIRCIALCVNIS
jgi:hypothetical protein